jgi:putative ubiquitin-RnfH superfamily antitoxin RatB of RatAB toxin-antitoxin module
MSRPEPVVEVVHARPERQSVVTVAWRDGLTALEAVQCSGLLQEFPEIASQELALGIFGRRVEGTQPLRDGDRVEIYRQLKVDPRDARRRAARSERGSSGRRQAGR